MDTKQKKEEIWELFLRNVHFDIAINNNLQ